MRSSPTERKFLENSHPLPSQLNNLEIYKLLSLLLIQIQLNYLAKSINFLCFQSWIPNNIFSWVYTFKSWTYIKLNLLRKI